MKLLLLTFCLILAVCCNRMTMRERMEKRSQVKRTAPEELIKEMEARGEKNVRARFEKRKEGLARLNKRQRNGAKNTKEVDELVSKVQASYGKEELVAEETILDINAAHQDYLYQGDIVLTEEEIDRTEANEVIRPKRGAPLTERAITRWDKKEPIPYYFDSKYPESSKGLIRKSVAQLSSKICLNITESDKPYYKIRVYDGKDCSASLGRRYPINDLSLAPSTCAIRPAVIQHEFMHALGIGHTMGRHDRDNYVRINWNSVDPFIEHNWYTFLEEHNNNYGLPYDYQSVMHYAAYAGTRNNQPIIIPRDARYLFSLGQRKALTFQDVKMINLMYNCKESCTTTISCSNGGYQNPKNCTACICNDFYEGRLCEKAKNENVFDGIMNNRTFGGTHITVAEKEMGPDSNNPSLYDMDTHEIRYVIYKAPPGRRMKVIVYFSSLGHNLGCETTCIYGGITIVDGVEGNLNGAGMTYCCDFHNDKIIETSSNLLGIKMHYPAGRTYSNSYRVTLI